MMKEEKRKKEKQIMNTNRAIIELAQLVYCKAFSGTMVDKRLNANRAFHVLFFIINYVRASNHLEILSLDG